MKLTSAGGIRAAVVLTASLLLAACSSGPNVVTNSAPGFSIVGYQTFSFLRPLSTDNGNVRTILSNELIEPTRRELEFAGLRHVETGGDPRFRYLPSAEALDAVTPDGLVDLHERAFGDNTGAVFASATVTVERISAKIRLRSPMTTASSKSQATCS